MRQRSRPARTIKPDAAASITSRAQRVVTIAIRPSVGHETAGVLKLICPTTKAENFCERGWTLLEVRQNPEVICPSGKTNTRARTTCSHMWVEKTSPDIASLIRATFDTFHPSSRSTLAQAEEATDENQVGEPRKAA